jgi:hypothetical protein
MMALSCINHLFFFALTLKLTLLIFSRNFTMNLSMIALHPRTPSKSSILQTFRPQNRVRVKSESDKLHSVFLLSRSHTQTHSSDLF